MAISSNNFISQSVVLLLLCFIFNGTSMASDTIYAGRSLSGSQTITSAGGIFELSFFTPGNSRNYYVGIWYKTLRPRTVVWVANRNQPVSGSSPLTLQLFRNGSLALLEQTKSTIWSTHSMSAAVSNSTMAVLLDNGNLVIRDELDSSAVLWQSFDHPTDTWLPGAKLGYNKLTKEKLFLTPWRNTQNPAPGIFSFEIEVEQTGASYSVFRNGSAFRDWPNADEISRLIYSGDDIYKNGNYIPLVNLTSVANENGSYLTYVPTYPHSFVRYKLLINGRLKFYDGGETKDALGDQLGQCTDYALCGAFSICDSHNLPRCRCLEGFEPQFPEDWAFGGYSYGCVRKTPFQCSDVGTYKFLGVPDAYSTQYSESLKVKSIEECILACSRDCSITAFAYDNDCKIWKGDILNLIQLPSSLTKLMGDRKLHIRVADSTNKVKRKATWIAIGVLAGFLSISTILMVYLKRKRSKGASPIVQDSLVLFKYKDLRRATGNFSEKLGEGGFGSVFKGILRNSTDIAVKELKYLEQGEKQFRAEVGTIGAIHHINVVRLWGFCTETSKRLLVYEYMPNGSLQSLFHQENALMLDWNARYHIAVGTARGLAYLHEECRDCIIHCDIKPDNILLDAEYSPKLADFGLAKLVGRHHSRVLTTMRGTVGYLAPEWFSGEAITPKADVFSYGMLLIEVITGRRNREGLDEGLENYHPLMVANVVNKGEDVGTLLDYRLEGRADKEELAKACKVACWCIQEDENDRPTMRQVVQILEGVSDVNIPPIPQFLQRLVQSPLEDINHLKTTCSSGSWSCSDDQSAFQAKINNGETNIHEDAPEGEHSPSLCTR